MNNIIQFKPKTTNIINKKLDNNSDNNDNNIIKYKTKEVYLMDYINNFLDKFTKKDFEDVLLSYKQWHLQYVEKAKEVETRFYSLENILKLIIKHLSNKYEIGEEYKNFDFDIKGVDDANVWIKCSTNLVDEANRISKELGMMLLFVFLEVGVVNKILIFIKKIVQYGNIETSQSDTNFFNSLYHKKAIEILERTEN